MPIFNKKWEREHTLKRFYDSLSESLVYEHTLFQHVTADSMSESRDSKRNIGS